MARTPRKFQQAPSACYHVMDRGHLTRSWFLVAITFVIAAMGTGYLLIPLSGSHFAGALGVWVWTLLSAIPDWRWLLERGDTPWYPTMRLFRQRQLGDWTEILERVVQAVAGDRTGRGRETLAQGHAVRSP